MQLTKRNNELKQYLTHISSTMSMMDSELRETSEKVASREAKFIELVEKSLKDRN